MDTLEVPYDMVENILVRLPVKSLLRFRAVSRKCEAIISDPVFARKHLESSPRKYIFTKDKKPSLFASEKIKLVEIKNQEFQVELKLNYPWEFSENSFMCYLDGLLLLQYFMESTWWHIQSYALWNLSTDACIKFVHPNSIHYFPIIYGLCYDPLMEDYKVVMGDEDQYTVFNCREKRWIKRKKFPVNTQGNAIEPRGVCFNGSLYWVLNKYPSHNSNFQIVRFDSRDDKFKKVSEPKGIQNNYIVHLILLGGHLCLYYNPVNQLCIMKKDDDQDSWREFIYIDIKWSIYPLPLFMMDENEIVLDFGIPSHYFAYNSSKKTFAEIKKNSKYIKPIVFPFVESLMLSTGNNKRVRRRQRVFEELREVFFFN